MRYFIALEIPSGNRSQFQPIQDKLHTLIPQVRITNLNKIHLTLAFLGEQPDQLKDQLVEIIKKAVKDTPSFEVAPAYIDGFPNIHHANVLWIGVKGDIDKLLIIREYIKDSVESMHLPIDERRFVPHITIAKSNENLQISHETETKLEEMMVDAFTPIQITSIKLFESEPDNGLHKHNTLAEIKLD